MLFWNTFINLTISTENSGHKFGRYTWGEQGYIWVEKTRAENLTCSLTCVLYSFIFLPLLQFCPSSFLLLLPLHIPYHTWTPFPPLCPAFHVAFLFLSSLSQQMKFPNVEVIFDTGKPEAGQQPLPWLICTLWPKCAIFKPYVPDLQEQLRPINLQRFDYLR